MKKIKKIAIFFLALVLLSPGLKSSASTLPVKDAWILQNDCIVVLREDGSLLISDSIASETFNFMVQDVSDFYGECYNGLMYGVILFKDGNVAILHNSSYQQKNSDFKLEIVANNAKQIYFLPYFQYAYIDNNDILKGKHNYVDIDNSTIVTNVKQCYDGTNYAITNDNKLIHFNVEKNTVTEIMTDVKDINCVNDLVVLRNNGDLYLIKDSSVPERIGVEIESIDKVGIEDTWTSSYSIDYVNKNGEYYVCQVTSSSTNLTKYMDNIRDLYVINNYRYAITNDDILYPLGQMHLNINLDRSKKYKAYNVSKLIENVDKFILNTNNKLYTNSYMTGGEPSRYILDDVINVIHYEGSVGYDDDLYLFIKNTGELYASYATKDYGIPQTPFLTSFCQKQTKVIINDKEVKLTSKIQLVNDRSMYPFRECLENMGATVLWDSVNQIAIGEYNGITIEFPIGKSEYWINGVKYEMDTTSYIDASIGRTYIPIRYAAEGLGFTVDWLPKDTENVISIYK